DSGDLGAQLLLAPDARFDLSRERAELAVARPPRSPPGTGEAVPGTGEAAEVGPSAAAMGGEHRADAAAAVAVGADDDAVVARQSLEHREPRVERQAVDDVP